MNVHMIEHLPKMVRGSQSPYTLESSSERTGGGGEGGGEVAAAAADAAWRLRGAHFDRQGAVAYSFRERVGGIVMAGVPASCGVSRVKCLAQCVLGGCFVTSSHANVMSQLPEPTRCAHSHTSHVVNHAQHVHLKTGLRHMIHCQAAKPASTTRRSAPPATKSMNALPDTNNDE
jgi:hypothetical protein